MRSFEIKRGGLRIVCEHSSMLQKPTRIMEIAPVLGAIAKVGQHIAAGVGGAAVGVGAGLANAGTVIGKTVTNAVPKLTGNFTKDMTNKPPEDSNDDANKPKFSWTR